MTKRILSFALTLVIMLGCMVLVPTKANAAVDVEASTYGFHIDSDYHSTTWYSSVNVLNVWKGSVLLGQAYQNVGIATLKSDTSIKTVLVRFMLCPEDTKSGTSWYHGINKEGKIVVNLDASRTYRDNKPDSSYVTYSDSCSFSLGGSVNSKGEFSGNVGIGASTTWANDCYDIVSKVTNNQKTITTTYAYTPTWNIISSAGRKKVNRWLNSTHKEYAMVQFDKDLTSTENLSITYTVSMWYAISGSSTWDGDTWDVFPLESTTTSTIVYT